MGKKTKFIPVFVVSLFFLILAFASATCFAAEKSANLVVKIDVVDAATFWSYPYISRDGKVRKPALIQVEWMVNNNPSGTKASVVTLGKDKGKVTITTARGAIVDIQINVLDDKNNVVGAAGLQVKNTGQTEYFTVATPDYTTPVITAEKAPQN